MSKRLTGLNPLAYMGVEPGMPSNTYTATTSPTPNDVQNFNIGDFWVNTTSKTLYVLVNQGRGVATWITTFGGAASSFVTDSGTATDIGGVINVLGDTTHIATSASGNTITVSLDSNPLEVQNLKIDGQIDGVLQADASGNITATNGTNGQLLIAGTGGPQWASLTAGSNITLTPGSHSLVIAASGSGGGGAVTFDTDQNSPSSESGGTIVMAGGHNITTVGTSGAGDTVTFNVSGTTNHAVQVGNSTNSLTSLTVGTNGQVLIGSTGANPVFATLTSGDGSVTFTPGPGTLSIQAPGGGGSGTVIVTPFIASGTWTKNLNTEYVEAFGWNAGGGGGSGQTFAAGNVSLGGGGGGSGSFFRFSGPAQFFGATATVTVGLGGAGGTGVSGSNATGNDGMPGGQSSFGFITAPIFVANSLATTGSGQQGGGGGGAFTNSLGVGGAVFIDGMPNRFYPAAQVGQTRDGAPVAGYDPTNLNNFNGGLPTAGAGNDGQFLGSDGGPWYGYLYYLGTSGGAGGSVTSVNTYTNGGVGGTVFALNGSTILQVGGTPGAAATPLNGGNGNDQPNNPIADGGFIFGGTGGGGGASNAVTGGKGGDGGFPGGGAGGGGAARNGGTSGSGGNGGNGLVIVIEWT